MYVLLLYSLQDKVLIAGKCNCKGRNQTVGMAIIAIVYTEGSQKGLAFMPCPMFPSKYKSGFYVLALIARAITVFPLQFSVVSSILSVCTV